MTKFSELSNIVNDALMGNDEAIEAQEELLEIVKRQGYNQGYADCEDELEQGDSSTLEDEEEEKDTPDA